MITIQDKLLKKIILIMLATGVLGILVGNLFIYPSFTTLLIDHAESEAIRIGNHLSWMLFPEGTTLERAQVARNQQLLEDLTDEFSLYKLKIFTSTGETVFSTDEEDVGVVNRHDYFHDQVARGKIYTKIVSKDSESLENETIQTDVVETYVPLIRDDRFVGALEIYYEITDRMKFISEAILLNNILAIGFLGAFLLVSLAVARRLDSNIAEREAARTFLRMTNIDLKKEIENRTKAEKEKEDLIQKLEKTLLELNTLKGLVPICSFCKNIRNDAGSWEKLEQYIEKHSDAEFSHGLCPECAAEHYPDLRLDEDDETYAKRPGNDEEEQTNNNSAEG